MLQLTASIFSCRINIPLRYNNDNTTVLTIRTK